MKTFKYINKNTWEVTKVVAKNRQDADQKYFEETGETIIVPEVVVKEVNNNDKPQKIYSSITFSEFEGNMFNKKNRRFYN